MLRSDVRECGKVESAYFSSTLAFYVYDLSLIEANLLLFRL